MSAIASTDRRVGRTAENLRKVAEHPEERRRDVWDDTAHPGTSASDRRVGAGSTARRNTQLVRLGMVVALEASRHGGNRAKSKAV